MLGSQKFNSSENCSYLEKIQLSPIKQPGSSLDYTKTNFPISLCLSRQKSFERRQARVSQGLAPEPDNISDRSLSLHYDPHPRVRTRTELKYYRKAENTFSSELPSLNKFLTPELRLNQREEKYRFSSPIGKTLTELTKERKLKDREYNNKIFGNVTIGIHKKELPKFEYIIKKSKLEIKDNNQEDIIENLSRYERGKLRSVDITCKPNETIPKYNESDLDGKYRRKGNSKIQALILQWIKNSKETNSEESGIVKKVKRKFRNENVDLRKQVRFMEKHIRSGGFSEAQLGRNT